MKFYMLTVYQIETVSTENWQAESHKEWYKNLDSAERMFNWHKYDQGIKDTTLTEMIIECPMIDETVYIPDWVRN